MTKKIIVCCLALAVLLAGCTSNQPSPSPTLPSPSAAIEATTPPTADLSPSVSPETSPTATDVVSSASITADPDTFKKSIGKDGTWIICLTADMTFSEELTLEGEFTNGKKDDQGKDIVQRKIALYTQDENRVVTARYTLTAPKLTIKSPNASIQHGTFKGDLYVQAQNFELVDNKVDGNIYFADDKAKSTFKMDSTSSVTGKQEIKK